MGNPGSVRLLRGLMWVLIVVEVPLYLYWLGHVSHRVADGLPPEDVARYFLPVLMPLAALLLTPLSGFLWWNSYVAQEPSPLRSFRGLMPLLFIIGYSMSVGVTAAEGDWFGAALLSAVVTTLGLMGLFFIPTALSPHLGAVIERDAGRNRREAQS